MGRVIDLKGQQLGQLVAIAFVGVIDHRARWRCLCACGASVVMMAQTLRRPNVTCGGASHRRASMLGKNVSHGKSSGRTYEIWSGMWKRCSNKSAHAYARYGGRGITVCERWRDFSAFLADMGEAPAEMEIERKDNDGNYESSNCRWATIDEQANNRGNNRVVMLEGQLLTVAEYAKALGLKYSTAYWRTVLRDKAPHRSTHARVMHKAPQLIWERDE